MNGAPLDGQLNPPPEATCKCWTNFVKGFKAENVAETKSSVNALAIVAALIATLSFTAILTPPVSSPPFVYPGHPYNSTEVKYAKEQHPNTFYRPIQAAGVVLPDGVGDQTIDPVFSRQFPLFVLFTQLAFALSMVALFIASIISAVVAAFWPTYCPAGVDQAREQLEKVEQCWWGMLVIFICIPLVMAYVFLLAAFGQVTAILTAGYTEVTYLNQEVYNIAFWIVFGLFGLSPLLVFLSMRSRCCLDKMIKWTG